MPVFNHFPVDIEKFHSLKPVLNNTENRADVEFLSLDTPDGPVQIGNTHKSQHLISKFRIGPWVSFGNFIDLFK